jgi:2-keto-4-pentenoate hydratase
MNPYRITIALVLLCTCRVATAQAPTAEAIKNLADDYFARRPSQTIHAGLTLDEARQTRREFIALLTPRLGPPVGYKVGLTSKAVQESVGSSTPVRGVLLRKMMLKNGAKVSAKFGARPIWEPDLIVVVKDAGISDAKTPLEVARHLSEVVAFIELPDRIVAETEKVDGNLITAVNASARLGVLGERAKIQATPEFLVALEKIASAELDRTELFAGAGNPPQRQRTLDAFKSGRTSSLVATDVAARGLDINDISHVVNYDPPESQEDYVHRIGRTGRGEKKGKALMFVE